jgi:hypothetical protein
MKQEHVTLVGSPSNIHRVKTNHSPRTFAIFLVNNQKAKCFGQMADQLLDYVDRFPVNTPPLTMDGYFGESHRFGKEFVLQSAKRIESGVSGF